MKRKVSSLLGGLSIVSLALLQACTSLPKASDAAPATKTNVSAIAPDNNRTEATPPVISSEPLPIADARVQHDLTRSTSKQPEYCAPENYKQFFWNFVKDNDMQNNRMRDPYTSASIIVRSYNDTAKILETVGKDEYRGFKISAVDYTMVYDDPSITDPNAKARLKIDFKRRTEDVFQVDYVRAEFEPDSEAEDNNGKLIRTYGPPGAYIFVHQDGCWRLKTEHRTEVTGIDLTPGPSAHFLESQLTKGMAYADLRKTALTNGWVPLASPNCKTNVGGAALVCDQIPEVNACSGDGYCLMFFKHVNSGKRFSVSTYGPSDDWQISGEASRLRVKQWGMVDPTAPLP
jgi:hypothetical protein